MADDTDFDTDSDSDSRDDGVQISYSIVYTYSDPTEDCHEPAASQDELSVIDSNPGGAMETDNHSEPMNIAPLNQSEPQLAYNAKENTDHGTGLRVPEVESNALNHNGYLPGPIDMSWDIETTPSVLKTKGGAAGDITVEPGDYEELDGWDVTDWRQELHRGNTRWVKVERWQEKLESPTTGNIPVVGGSWKVETGRAEAQ